MKTKPNIPIIGVIMAVAGKTAVTAQIRSAPVVLMLRLKSLTAGQVITRTLSRGKRHSKRLRGAALQIERHAKPNQRCALDAGRAGCFHAGGQWPGTDDLGSWTR